MLNIQKFVFSPFYENTYLIWDESTKDAAIIDPGCYDSKERETVDLFIAKELLQIKYLVNTHCHIDHIFGNAYVKEKYHRVLKTKSLRLKLVVSQIFLINSLRSIV